MMPFAGAVTDTANATLVFSVIAALLYAVVLEAQPLLTRTAVKTLAVGLLAVLALARSGPPLLVCALALSALGDAFLSREGERAFLAGLASFLAAHLVYIALFYLSGGSFGILAAEPWRAGVAVAMAVFALFMLAQLLGIVAPDMRLPIFAYVLAILAMGVTALTLGNAFVIFGAVLFMASDAILASEKFLMASLSLRRSWARLAVWVLYYAAQLLITLGFMLA
jgi:uncharacterized membrane protein YhhN